MRKKYSSFKKQQKLFENWREYSKPKTQQQLIQEEVTHILEQYSAQLLNEAGVMNAIAQAARKLGVDKMLLLTALAGGLASADVNASELSNVVGQVQDQTHQVDQQKSYLEFSSEEEAVQHYAKQYKIPGGAINLTDGYDKNLDAATDGTDKQNEGGHYLGTFKIIDGQFHAAYTSL